MQFSQFLPFVPPLWYPGGGFLFASSRQLRAQAATEVASEGLPEVVEVVEEAEGGETGEPSAGEGEAEVEEDENQRPRVKTKALTKQVKHIMNVRRDSRHRTGKADSWQCSESA